LIVPSRFVAQLHPHFREVMQVLAIQAADEARHIEVFTRRALLKSREPGLSTAGGQASCRLWSRSRISPQPHFCSPYSAKARSCRCCGSSSDSLRIRCSQRPGSGDEQGQSETPRMDRFPQRRSRRAFQPAHPQLHVSCGPDLSAFVRVHLRPIAFLWRLLECQSRAELKLPSGRRCLSDGSKLRRIHKTIRRPRV